MGRTKYNYVPEIQTQIGPDGKKKAVVMCKAFPDKDKEFFNYLSIDDLEDKLY